MIEYGIITGTPEQKLNMEYFSEEDDEIPAIRQSSMYNEKNRARIDNNQFFESRSNPLSSKGN